MAKSKGAVDNQMKLIILTISLLLTSGIAIGEEHPKYIDSEIDFNFKKPEGSNTPTVNPLEGIKTVSYQDDVHFPNNIFYLLERSSQLKQYPCSTCHTGEPINTQSLSDDQNPHDRITLKHGQYQKMSCVTCHDQTAPDQLKGMNGLISINEAPKLCGTCHSTQYKDWIHGAHGKRYGSWAEQKIYFSCAQCHDPHDPSFKSRDPQPKPNLNRFDKN